MSAWKVPFRLLLVAMLLVPSRALALEKLCDPAFENCRQPLVSLIRAETKGIDVAFWFMEDTNLAQELVNRWKAGVPVRVLMDTEANATYPANATSLKMLKDAGIPVTLYGGKETSHGKINADIGLPEDPGTKALTAFLEAALKK